VEAKKRCPQCWQEREYKHFISLVSGQVLMWCDNCRAKYKGKDYGERASKPRRGLPVFSPNLPMVTWQRESKNEKLGPMPSALISGETCPPTCGFYGRGCYHEFSFMGYHWRNVKKNGMHWDEFLETVSNLPDGTIWRYATAGDLPGNGTTLDVRAVVGLVFANQGKRGFAFTHKPMDTEPARNAVQYANNQGFTINLSADGLRQADEKAELGIAPVAAVIPSNAPEKGLKTPAGRKVLICLHETRGLTCHKCQLCAVADRKSIIGFRAHGSMAATVSRIVSDD
jgi:hypothetical protein